MLATALRNTSLAVSAVVRPTDCGRNPLETQLPPLPALVSSYRGIRKYGETASPGIMRIITASLISFIADADQLTV